jgi:hypothetical protein
MFRLKTCEIFPILRAGLDLFSKLKFFQREISRDALSVKEKRLRQQDHRRRSAIRVPISLRLRSRFEGVFPDERGFRPVGRVGSR